MGCSLDVYKEQVSGMFICKLCNNGFTSLEQAMNCSKTHDKPVTIRPEVQETSGSLTDGIREYREMVKDEGTVKLAEKLCMSLIEDYLVSRQKDIQEKGRVSAMTLSLGKIAAEALINLNKVTAVSKSVNVNVEGGKKSDISALKTLLEGKEEGNGDSEN